MKMTKLNAIIPAPPTPWKTLPTNSRVRLDARQHRMVPRVKEHIDPIRITGRPNILLSSDKNGMVTALVRRYEVPIQMPPVVSKPKSMIIACENQRRVERMKIGGAKVPFLERWTEAK